MRLIDQLTYDQIEGQLHQLLGRFFVTFAGIELNLSLQVGGNGSFKDKLDRFIDIFGTQVDAHVERFCEVAAWYMAADSVREARNLFAHGRWGIAPATQIVAHVSGYPPAEQVERRFSLAELEALVKDAESLIKELLKIACRQ